MTPEIVRQLAPHGTLRAALNLSNFLLVSGKDADGVHTGVAPDMARAKNIKWTARVGFGLC